MMGNELGTNDWLWRITATVGLFFMGWAYSRGWLRLAKDRRPPQWGMITFAAGLGLIGFCLVSPFGRFGERYFFIRTLQHVLLTGLVPLLLLVADPYPVLKASLSAKLRESFEEFVRRPNFRKWATWCSSPGLVLGEFVAIFWFWHDPAMIAAASRFPVVRFLELGSLTFISCLYWWQISEAAPRLHRPMPPIVRILYALCGMLPIKLLGLVMLFGLETRVGGGNVAHDSAELMVTIGNFTMADKSLGALLLWVMGGFAYTYTAIYFATRAIGKEGEKPSLPTSILEGDEIWRAPAIRN